MAIYVNNKKVAGFGGRQGPPGPQGATGPQGEQGIPGDQGPPGPAGANGSNGRDGENGATFTPAVSEAGVLSWSNDKGLSNPDPVDIKGPAGQDGQNGAPGPAGPAGADGKTPYIGSNGNWWIGTTDTGISASGGGTAGVESFNGRTGAVTPQQGDYTAAMVGAVPAGQVQAIQALTQTEYDALASKSTGTLYLIKE